jgi:hypothetical protein
MHQCPIIYYHGITQLSPYALNRCQATKEWWIYIIYEYILNGCQVTKGAFLHYKNQFWLPTNWTTN